ncbi:hypothetical protein MCC93_22510 [Morococcus cerebrosus]|uniref:Uncharacterized protein n=1 Tax=Morococcus cerebrosus TaxID=1056807 RepID=A0A0C1GL97_9NEIS|nr:hypothetical protein MCC93_22510 [Morococcus cerebrosus]
MNKSSEKSKSNLKLCYKANWSIGFPPSWYPFNPFPFQTTFKNKGRLKHCLHTT